MCRRSCGVSSAGIARPGLYRAAAGGGPGSPYMPAHLALPVVIGLAIGAADDGALFVPQIGEQRDEARRQVRVAALAGFGAPEDRPGAREIDVAPVEFDRFRHARAGAEDKAD